MKKLIKQIKKNHKISAFTLIEMVIVLFIIGLLMLLILPNLGAQKNKAQSRTDKALVTTIQTQMNLYEDDLSGQTVTLDKLKSIGAISDQQFDQAKKAKITIGEDGVVSIAK